MFEKFKSMEDDLAEIKYRIEKNNSIISSMENMTSSASYTIPAIASTCSVGMNDGDIFFDKDSESFNITSEVGCITLNRNAWDNVITAWATPAPPEPKLNMISCPCCGQGEVRKTKIDGIVECIYCNRQFTLSY